MKNTLPDRVRIGVFEADLRGGELRRGKRRILLQAQSVFVLRLLVEHSGEIVTREELKQKLWPNDTVVDFDHGINAAVRRLRHAFGDSAEHPKYIETVARRGYRLLAAVEHIAGITDDASCSSDDFEEVADGRTRTEASRLIGRKVSHYRVLGVIGGGGMGLVYEAEDLKLGRRVALKFLPEELAGEPHALQRFEREARAASSLDHPNICTVHEVEEHKGQPFIVMQLLRGETLRDRLAAMAAAQQRFSLSELTDLAVQICDGLATAHANGIIHRDIKPANIFLTTAGQAKILDFGLAKLIEAEERHEEAIAAAAAGGSAQDVSHDLTITGLTMGTAGYMSPEQIRGEKLDARTDLFSFGLVLYEMASGHRAFSGETAAVVKDAIQHQAPVPIHERNAALPLALERIINRAMEKHREQRYQSAEDIRADVVALAEKSVATPVDLPHRGNRSRWIIGVAVLCALVAAVALYWRGHRTPRFAEQDTVVIADFANSTGDPVFDETLKQALTIQLEQSPFLNVLPSRRIGETLKLMNRSTSEPVTAEVGREVCLRSGSKAAVIGSIALSGTAYLIGLNAVDCSLGRSLTEVRERAADKEHVLSAVDKAARHLRSKLGESLDSLEKYAMPLQEATTPSLEALRAYSMALKTRMTKGTRAAIPLFQRAVELDPNFAAALNQLAGAYRNANEGERAEEYARKAYALRDRVSERERFAITANYYDHVTGELEKAAQIYELWQVRFPRDSVPVRNLGAIYARLGNMEKYLEQSLALMRLEPNFYGSYESLANAYENLNRLDESEQVFSQAQQRKLGGGGLFIEWYVLAFLKGDKAQMAQLAEGAKQDPSTADALLATLADTEAWYGRLKNGRKLRKQAIDSVLHDNANDAAALYLSTAATSEAPAVDRQQTRADAMAALKLSQDSNVKVLGALALAMAGDIEEAQKLAAELDKAFPQHTGIQSYWLPTIRAAVALESGDPNRALELLNSTSVIELGALSDAAELCPIYLRGEAYLMLGNGKAASAEFQKFIDHYGIVGSFTWGVLARLGLARAYALEAQTDPSAREKALTAYQNFLTLWKDADPDIPIYKQAKAEYANLQ